MRNKKSVWNISQKEGKKKIIRKLDDIITNNGDMIDIDTLRSILIKDSIGFKKCNQVKNTMFYINEKFSGLTNFIDNSDEMYIFFKGNKLYVQKSMPHNIDDWIII